MPMKIQSRAIERLEDSQRGLADRLPKPKVDKLVKLNSGGPAFPTPGYIIEAAYRAMREGYMHYPPVQGDPQLREAIAGYQSSIRGVPVSPGEVMVTAGGTGGITAAMMALFPLKMCGAALDRYWPGKVEIGSVLLVRGLVTSDVCLGRPISGSGADTECGPWRKASRKSAGREAPPRDTHITPICVEQQSD